MNVDINNVLIITFVPPKFTNAVRDAVCKCGAGVIGNYTNCTFSLNGKGTFKPNNNATPFIGKKNKLVFAKEKQLQFICPANKAKAVISALKSAHPYEEPGINIIPLLSENDL